jgi:hypothetical protein
MLIAAIALGLVPLEQSIGVFHHGQWRGQCYQDGFLSGLDHEFCAATLSGGLNVRLERDADKLLIIVAPSGCAAGRRPAVVSSRDLSRPDRTDRVLATIQGHVASTLKPCHGRAATPSLSKRDLDATLKQTDGLIHLDPPFR